MTDHYLPSKLPTYLLRLDLEYTRAGAGLLLSIIRNARALVVAETTYDNWNGGTYGHDVILFIPRDVMARIQLGKQEGICSLLRSDLNICASGVSNESFPAVHLELNDENDPQFQQAKAFGNKKPISPEIPSIWRSGYVRLFVSHRDNYKRQAQRLARELEAFGISCFVAHDTIEPMEAWQHEIEKGLATMEIMLALVTSDFHDSVWTNQEVGYALGSAIPIIALKLESQDPAGFIGERQALKANVDEPESAAADLYQIIAEKLGQRARLQTALVSAFATAPDFSQAKIRFQRLERLITRLTDKELAQLIAGFETNPQLHNAIYLNNEYNRLVHFLEKVTAQKFNIKGKTISKTSPVANIDDEIPF
jgi:hypothetical protein